jgi:ABC-2 type transport system ATP-binding protein
MTGQAIRVREMRKRYGDVVAIDGLDLDIRQGEIFALLGPNGAGKSTTIEIFEGYRYRDSGEVSVLGMDPALGDRQWRARIGIVAQFAHDMAVSTVREIISHFARFYPHPRDIEEVIEQTGLAQKANARLHSLSGGQRRRVDVALSLIGRPELVFLDEPTTGFDPEARRQFWDLVQGLSRDGTTIMLTTHYLEEAEALADRVGVIFDGRLQALSTPATLGGRDRAAARVSWVGTDGPRSIETFSPAKTVVDVFAWYGGEVPGLTITRPSLEDVYLAMIKDAG